MKTGWTIGKRLTAGFCVVGGITLVLGLSGYYGAATTAQDFTEVVDGRVPAVEVALTLQRTAAAVRATQQALVTTQLQHEARQGAYQEIADARAHSDAACQKYESLTQAAVGGDLWPRVTDAWRTWWAENDKFFALCRQVDERGVPEPVELKRLLEVFRGDHHKARARVLTMVHTHEVFDGGTDPTLCNFGKWSADYSVPNPQVMAAVHSALDTHRDFHRAVASAKQSVSDGQYEAALEFAVRQVNPLAETVLANFDRIQQEAEGALTAFEQAAAQLAGPCQATRTEVDVLLDKLVAANQAEARAHAAAAQASGRAMTRVALAAMLAGVAAALALGWSLTRRLNRTLNHQALQLSEGAEQVGSAAAQVAAASQQLAEGASTQASSLEETSSALEEMAAMARSSAESARSASDLAAQAHQSASAGEQTVARLNAAMDAINDSAAQISKIIKVIEEIAFQTNLLALNAAVEAARAGEHGRGFAVVAEEVRNLAQRCAEAARGTTNLIEDSVVRARDGTAAAGTAAEALQVIVGHVVQVAELLNGIRRSADEQAQGVEQINLAVAQMDKVTQQNAAGAEESASAAEELHAQSQTLRAVVNELLALVRGQTGGNGRVPTPPAASPKQAPQVVRTRSSVPQRPADGGDGRADEFGSLSDF